MPTGARAASPLHRATAAAAAPPPIRAACRRMPRGGPLEALIVDARIGVAAVKYEPAAAHYLGGADVTRTTVTVMKASGVASLDDAKRKEVLMGASGKSGQNYVVPTVLNHVLGTRFRIVIGYPGINAVN